MKRILSVLSLITAILVLTSFRAEASQEIIENFEVEITVNQDGTISVTEEILYDFGQNNRRGIFRTIPATKTNEEGRKFRMEFDNFKITDEADQPLKFTLDRNQDINIRIGDPNETVTGLQTYVISYQVSGALTYFENHDELYWNAIGTDWEVPIRDSRVIVELPATISGENINAVCYTGPKFSEEEDCQIEQTDNTLEFRSEDAFQPGEGITIVTTFPKNYVEVLEPTPYRSVSSNLIVIGVAVSYLMGNVILPIRKTVSLIRQRKRIKNNSQVVSAWFDPPRKKEGGFFSPGQTAAITGDLKPRIVTAEIIYLAQQGYLKIIQTDNKDFGFSDIREPDDNLEEHQKTILKSLINTQDTKVTQNNINRSHPIGSIYNDIVSQIYKELKKENITDKNHLKSRNSNVIIAFLSLFIGGFINFIVYLIAAMKEKHLTDQGIKAYSEALSLKNFLSSQKEQLEHQAQNQKFFERLFSYATAFGVEKTWASRFEGLLNQKPNWYEGDFTASSFLLLSSRMNRNVSKSVNYSRTSSSGFSSGSSGGFSGGGGGGGGGGSW